MIRRERVTANLEGDFVVFLIGMRINKPWKVHKWLPVASAMPKMLKELYRQPELGFIHAESWFGRTLIMVQYWRSMDQLLAYAKDREAQHLPAWQAFNKAVGTDGTVGVSYDARLVLGAYGLTEKDVQAEYLKPGPAGERLQDGAMDAYFFVGGYPTGAIVELASTNNITLVPITGPEADKLLSEQKFFSTDTVPADTYKNVGETKTISVAAQWVTSAKQTDDLIYKIVKSLYSDATQKALQAGHAKGKLITLANAVTSAGIPFHPGAEKFYKEAGTLK